MLPGFDGLEALALARALTPVTPFLFLSGTIGEERAVEALKRGATDYVIKDRPGRLIPAIRQAFALLEESERRRRIEETLREHQERFRQITENVAELIAVLDLGGRRTYANPAYRSLLGDPAGIKLVITDMMLPDGSGMELVGAMLRLQPAVECLSQPMTSEGLLGAVNRALASVPA